MNGMLKKNKTKKLKRGKIHFNFNSTQVLIFSQNPVDNISHKKNVFTLMILEPNNPIPLSNKTLKLVLSLSLSLSHTHTHPSTKSGAIIFLVKLM